MTNSSSISCRNCCSLVLTSSNPINCFLHGLCYKGCATCFKARLETALAKEVTLRTSNQSCMISMLQLPWSSGWIQQRDRVRQRSSWKNCQRQTTHVRKTFPSHFCKQGKIDCYIAFNQKKLIHGIPFCFSPRATDFQLLHQASQHPFLTPGRLADAQSDYLSCSVSLQCSSSYWPPAFGRYQDGLWGLQLVWMWCSGHYSFKSCSWMDTTATISGLAFVVAATHGQCSLIGFGIRGRLTNHVLWGSQSCEFLNSLETETSPRSVLVHQLGIDRIVQ